MKHTSAFYVEPHSQESQIIELKGNGKKDVKLRGITGNFYKSEYKEIKPRIIVPGVSLSAEDVHAKSHFRSPYVFVPKGRTLEKLMKVSPNNPKSLREFDSKIRKKNDGVFIFYTFPPAQVVAKLKSYAAEGRVGALVFSVPPFEEKRFNAQQYYDIRELAKYGVEVVWDSSQFGRMHFHRYAFMKPEKRGVFDKAYSSNSIMTVFGSHRPLSVENVNELAKVISGFYTYTGGRHGYGTVFTGGGPGSMTQALHLALVHNMLTGAISLIKEGEYQSTDAKPINQMSIVAYSKITPDFFVPFSMEDINVRQDTLLAMSNVHVITEGGVGTFSEFYEICVKKGFYFTNEPIFLVGNPRYFKPLMEQMEIMDKAGRISSHIRKQVYFIPNGDRFLPKMIEHYKFQKKGM